jgi:LPXTG-site transpeptidase (sortase) family protein
MNYIHLLLTSAGSLVILTGCAAAPATPVRISSPGQATAAPLLISQRSIVPASGKQKRPLQYKSAPGTVPVMVTHLPVSPTSTPLPPTPLPPISTATATPLPIINLPAQAEHPAPEVPSRLLIPVINLDVPIVAVGWSVTEIDGQAISEWDVPNWRAAGWLNTSAPVGVPGNTVLEGHQDIDGRVFENLEYLKEGDEIQVQTAAQTRKYLVALRTIVLDKDQPPEVRRANARWIGPSNDERLTLVTCWPRNDNTHRLILVALPVP